jgi:stage V sporulation protein D (sporulation-specific penicillin-binding protein)
VLLLGNKQQKRKTHQRLRGDSGHHRRILAVMALLGVLAFVPVAVQLTGLMVGSFDYYSRKALRNQTRTTQVAADRGTIYDRNMNILACSRSVENVYLDPHELKQSKADIPAIGAELGRILDLDPQWIEKQAADIKMRYKQVEARVSEETAS